MIDIDGVRAGTAEARLGPEEISLRDFDGLIALMIGAARHLDSVESFLVDRLDRRYDELKSLLN